MINGMEKKGRNGKKGGSEARLEGEEKSKANSVNNKITAMMER